MPCTPHSCTPLYFPSLNLVPSDVILAFFPLFSFFPLDNGSNLRAEASVYFGDCGIVSTWHIAGRNLKNHRVLMAVLILSTSHSRKAWICDVTQRARADTEDQKAWRGAPVGPVRTQGPRPAAAQRGFGTGDGVTASSC